jgi:gliding motility-associated lipoprotein GldB
MAIKIQLARKYNKLIQMVKIVFFFCLALLFSSCNRNPLKINVSDIELNLRMMHFDADLLKLKNDEVKSAIPVLKEKYGDFFNIFTYRMIGIGGAYQDNFSEMLYSFISDTLIQKLQVAVAEKIDTVRFRENLTEAFKHYKYYFPEKEIPTIYTCISGFNQSIVVAEHLAGVSLDKYLGATSSFYEQLGLPVYKRRNMHQGKIVPDLLYGWAVSEWPKADNANNLLSQMIQEGKMMYFLDAMLPELDDALKIGYTEKQMEFCKKNEASMWTFLAEHKELYTTDRMNIKRYNDDGPYTASFSEQSPGRTGVWIGWQIVRSYMKEHPEVKLSELLRNQDFQGILNQSGYQP